jgi:hypothetical protein
VLLTLWGQTNGETDRQAIAAGIDRFVEAWNRHDAKAFAAAFTEDADFTNWRGEGTSGRSKVEERQAFYEVKARPPTQPPKSDVLHDCRPLWQSPRSVKSLKNLIRSIHTVEVVGSNPTAPTISSSSQPGLPEKFRHFPV